jgi:hypothetical protein
MTTNMTDEEVVAEISDLKAKIEQLELDIMLLKVTRINDSVPQPIQPWVAPWQPQQSYWQKPILTYCGTTTTEPVFKV